MFLAFILLEVFGGRHAVGEGDGERVQRGLPPHGPSCLPGAFGVHPAGDQVQRLQRGLLGGEVPAGPDGPAVAGVEGLDGVGGEQDPADLDVVEPVAKCGAVPTLGKAVCVRAGTSGSRG